MIDYSAEVARIEDERCGNQWRRAEDYASLASRLREERDEWFREAKAKTLELNSKEFRRDLIADNALGGMLDACAAGPWRDDVENIPQRGRILIQTANGHIASVWYDFVETSFVDGHFCYDVPDVIAWAEIRQPHSGTIPK